MSNSINWVVHPDGTDTNGGGYSDEYAGTWSQWHSSFGPVDAITGGTTSDNGGGKVRITKTGEFDGAAVGMVAYFSATNYTAGHYVIIAVDASDNYVDLNCAYVDAQTDAVVNVGGTLKNLQTAMNLSQQQVATINSGSWTVTDEDGGTTTSKRIKLTNTGAFANYHDNTVAYYPHAEGEQVHIDFASGGSDDLFTVYAIDDNSITVNRAYVSSTITAVYIRYKRDNIMVCQGTHLLYDRVNQYGAVQYNDGNAASYLRPEHIIFGVDPDDGTELDENDTWPVFQAADEASPCTSAGTISDNGGYVKVTFVSYNPSTSGIVAGDWCYVNWSGTDSAPYVDGRFQIRSVASDSVTLELGYADPGTRTVTALYWGNWDNHSGTNASSCMLAPFSTASQTYYAGITIHHIIFDGNSKAPVGLYFARQLNNYFYTFIHDVEIKNNTYYGFYSGCYTLPPNEKASYNIYNLNIHDCVQGMRSIRGGNVYYCKFYSNTEYALSNASYITENCLFYNNKYGIYAINSSTLGKITKCTFCNNTSADMYFYDGYYSTRYQGFKDCLFYNTVSLYGVSGTYAPNSEWWEFIDCCVTTAITTAMFSSTISYITQIGTKVLTESPFVNISGDDDTWDLRLKHDGADYAKLMDATTGRICGALGFAPVDFPDVNNVVYPDTVNGEDGDYVSPATSIVKDGEFYGPDSSYEGEYAGGIAEEDIVDPKYVLTGHDNYVDGDAGTLTLPLAADVWHLADDYGVVGELLNPAMVASDIANCTAANIKKNVVIDDVTGTYDPMAAAVFPAAANVSTVETAYGPTGAEYAGSLNMSLYVLTANVVSADYTVVGHDNYTGGSAGTYPTTATSKAEQLSEDQAAVTAAASSIKDDTEILGVTGTYDFTAALDYAYEDGGVAGHAAQLATDQTAVDAVKAYITTDVINLLGVVDGTLDMSLYTLTSGIVFPEDYVVWYGTGDYGPTGTEYTPAMRASDIPVTNGVGEYLSAGDIVLNVIVDDLTGSASGGGGEPPAAPAISLDSDEDSITVSLDGEAGVTNYAVYKTSGAAAWTAGGSRSGDGEVVISGLTAGTTYLVSAYSDNGAYSLWSPVQVITLTADASTDPSGSLSIPLGLLVETLAGSAAFRAWVGATAGTEAENLIAAKARIYEYESESWTRPYALVSHDDLWAAEKIADGTHNLFSHNGELFLGFEADATGTDAESSARAFSNTVGTILDEMKALAGTPGYLNIVDIMKKTGPQRCRPDRRDDTDAAEDYWLIELRVRWSD